MTSTSTEPTGSSNTNSAQRAEPGTGHFMLTLCRLPAPVSIRPPQSPHLKPFTFFTSSEPQPDGSERLYLHMGYFETLADAERWVNAVRGRYPDAIATLAPTASSRPPAADCAPAKDESLTDTQVMKILEARGTSEPPDGAQQRDGDPIALLRPEDTSTRAALKEAVAQGAPVSFAVQLQWSTEPINAARVPALAIFKGYSLYAVESRREGRSRYFLRIGFFTDPVSAKQVAAQVRSNFASAAVVPVEEQEVTRAREAGTGNSSIPCLVQQRTDPTAVPEAKAPSAVPRPLSRRPKTLMQTLKQLAEREMWTDPDSLSESGVRHLKVEVRERMSRRS